MFLWIAQERLFQSTPVSFLVWKTEQHFFYGINNYLKLSVLWLSLTTHQSVLIWNHPLNDFHFGRWKDPSEENSTETVILGSGLIRFLFVELPNAMVVVFRTREQTPVKRNSRGAGQERKHIPMSWLLFINNLVLPLCIPEFLRWLFELHE